MERKKWAHTTSATPEIPQHTTMTEDPSMLSRLVWYRSNSNDDDGDASALWTPAVYYASHREAIPAFGGLASLQDDLVLQRTLTMQLIQEQIQAASVPLLRLLLPTNNENTLQVRTINDNVELERDFVKQMIHLCDETNASSHVYRTQLQHVYQLLRQEEGRGDGNSDPVVMSQPMKSNKAKPTATTKKGAPLDIEEDDEEDIVVNDDEEEVEAWTNEVVPMDEEDEEEPSGAATTMRRVSVSVRKPQTRKQIQSCVASSSSVTPPYQPLLTFRAKRNSSSALLTQEEPVNDRDRHKKLKPLSKNDLQTPKPNPQKKGKTPSPHWWKHNAIPTTEQIQPILKSLGFQFDSATHRYSLPKNTHPSNQKWTMGLTGLRKFLCCYGIPNYANTQSRLSALQQERLRRWLVFANVPCQTKDDARRLRTLSSPKKTDQLLSQLYTLGFSTVDGKLFVPEYKQMTNYQGRPVHGQHYFDLDKELSTQVRVYIRGAWRLGVVNEYRSSKEMSQKYRDTLLPVRLWAAASSQPLPVFRDLPDDDYLRPFTQMSDDEEDMSDSEEEEEEENTELSDEDSVQITKVVPSPETSVASSTDDDTASSVDYDDSPLWFLKTALPDFTKVIWPVLQKKLGFFFRSGAYGHPDACEGRVVGSSKDLQAFCAQHGIPNYADAGLTDSERRALYRWAAFAHVPVASSHSVTTLRDTPLLTDRQVRDLLLSQQFNFLRGGTIVPPPGLSGEIPARFASLEELRVFLRGSADLLRRRTPQLVALRLWAARSAAPLPTFLPMTSMNSDDDSDDGSLEDKDQEDIVNAPSEDEKSELFESLDDGSPESNKQMDDIEENVDASPTLPEEVHNAPTILFPEAAATPKCSLEEPNAFFSCEQPIELDRADGPVSKSSNNEEVILLDHTPNDSHHVAAPTKLLFPGSPSGHDKSAANTTLSMGDKAANDDDDSLIDTAKAKDFQCVDDAATTPLLVKRMSPTVSVLETVGFDDDDDDSMADTDEGESWEKGFKALPIGFATQYDPTNEADDDDDSEDDMEDDWRLEGVECLPTPMPNALTTQPEVDADDNSDFARFGF
jgi:hypothetical protein